MQAKGRNMDHIGLHDSCRYWANGMAIEDHHKSPIKSKDGWQYPTVGRVVNIGNTIDGKTYTNAVIQWQSGKVTVATITATGRVTLTGDC